MYLKRMSRTKTNKQVWGDIVSVDNVLSVHKQS